MRLLNTIREIRFAKSQSYLFNEEGTLLNSFYHSKTIFIHIPKTAGLSLVNAIYGKVQGGGHRRYTFYKHILGDKLNHYFTYSFVRNPYDRLYSAYKFLEIGGVNNRDIELFQLHLSRYTDFEDFVMNGLTKKLMQKIIHFIPQHYFICINGNIVVDFLGRFESIEEDANVLSKKLKLEIDLPRLNSTLKSSYIDVYTNEMLLKVWSLYKEDFLIFGYSQDV